MRLPDPIANTTTEAYLAYKAGVLAEGDLKPKLYEPYIHLDAWLAYWCGLTTTYPVKNVGKNLFDKDTGIVSGYTYSAEGGLTTLQTASVQETYIPVSPNTAYTLHTSATASQTTNFRVFICEYTASKTFIQRDVPNPTTSNTNTITTTANTHYVRLCFSTVGIDTLQFEAGSEATAYEPYTGEPEMLTDEEAFIAYLSGVTNTYPEEFRDPADIRVAAYLRYLISARWGRPEYPVTNEELYLSLMKTKFIPSGDPSSDIVIDGTAKAPFVDVKMYGDTYQQSYTGKNLLGLTYTADITSNGVESFWNGSHLAFSGKATSTQVFLSQYIANNFPAGDYVLSLTKPASSRIIFRFFDGNNSTLKSFTIEAGESSVAVNLDGTEAKYRFVMLAGVGVEYNRSYDIQLEKGSTPTSFEPYVGGVPSPNPDYPQQIQTVTGEQTVTVVGKNLFNKDTSTLGLLNGDGTIGSSSDYFTSDFIRVVPETMYHKTQTTSARFKFYNINKTPISSVYDDIPSAGDAQSFTTPSSCYYIRFSFKFNTKNSIQIEKGSTATSYAPYSKQTLHLNLGKNLIDMSQTWVRGTLNNSSIEVQPNDNTILSDYIKVEPNTTYVFSQKQLGGKEVKPNIVSFFKDKVNVRTGFIQVLTSSPQSFTTSNDTCYIRVGYYNPTGLTLDTWLDYVTDLQLEVGSTATPYAPYFTPIELCKLGTYQDYIWKDGEDWKVHKVTGNTTYDGSNDEIWTKSNSTANQLFIGRADEMSKDNNVTVVAKSDKFTYIDRAIIYAQSKIGFTTQTTGDNYAAIRVGLGLDSTVTTVTSFRSWLAENITTVYYPLATATGTTITNQALIDQLEALVAGGAENGTTYIKVNATDPNLPGLLYVEAPKYE